MQDIAVALKNGKNCAMIFSGQEPSDSMMCWIPTNSGREDHELFNLFTDTIKWLMLVVIQARSCDLSKAEDRERWPSELLLGYSILAVNESRALLLLVQQGLNRQARVHFRSLYDFELRMRRILDKEANIALDLRDAYAFEARALGKSNGTDASVTEANISRAIGVSDTLKIIGQKESKVLGGNMREAMRGEPAPEKRYLGTVAWASQMSHGTVMALGEVADAINGAGEGLFDIAASDNFSKVLLYQGSFLLIHLMVCVSERFKISLPEGATFDELAPRADAINARMNIIPPQVEARAMKIVDDHYRGLQNIQRPLDTSKPAADLV